MRQTLPQRRRAETFTVVHWGQPFVVTVGFFDDGTPGEVFVDSRKTGGDVEAIARDAAVVISLALQHGAACCVNAQSVSISSQTVIPLRRKYRISACIVLRVCGGLVTMASALP